ncbi:MAG: hypothetical protein AAGA68_09595 [Pseudomonadota bacterium]
MDRINRALARSLSRACVSLGLFAALTCWVPISAANVEDLAIDDPRAYAWFVGDEFTRTLRLKIEPGWQLDRDALPQVGRVNFWLELVALEVRSRGLITDLALTYRLTNAIGEGKQSAQRVLPSWELYTTRPGRRVPINVPEWSLTQLAVVPLTDAEFLTAADVRADLPPLPAPWSAHFVRLSLVGLAVLVLGLYLFYCHFGAVWLARWRRPFTAALRDLRNLAKHAAEDADAFAEGPVAAGLRRFHAAVNEAAGRVVMRDDLDEFFSAQPLYATERGAIADVFEHSHRFFFTSEGDTSNAPDRAPPIGTQRLVDVCRRLSVLELSAP